MSKVKAPKSISEPSLHKIWSEAKKAAAKAVKKLDKTQQKAFTDFTKKSFKKDLGPNLDKFGKLFPDFRKMKSLVNEQIFPAIKAYKSAISGSSFPPEVIALHVNALDKIATLQKKRLVEAEKLISTNVDLATKASNKKTPPPIVVFQHPDISRLVIEKAGKLKELELTGKLSLEVIIDEPEVLNKFSESKEHSNAAIKIKDAGDFSTLIADIAKMLKALDAKMGKDGGSLKAFQKAFDGAVEKAIDQSMERATKEAARLGGLKAKTRWAKAKRGGKLLLAFGGAAAAIAGLALTPFTGGVSTVASCLGLAKVAVNIGKQLADIASSAEEMANGIAKDLNTLKKQYGKWLDSDGVSNKMGTAELAKATVNAFAPTLITTISSVQDDAGTYEEKIDNLEVKADNLSDNLTEWMSKQNDAKKFFAHIKSTGLDALTPNEKKLLDKLMTKLATAESTITKLIKAVMAQNKRVKDNRKNASKLNKELKVISSKNPLWSQVASVVVETTSSVAFSLAGNINAPDAYSFAKSTMDIVGAVDQTLTTLQDINDLSVGLHDSYKERKERLKA